MSIVLTDPEKSLFTATFALEYKSGVEFAARWDAEEARLASVGPVGLNLPAATLGAKPWAASPYNNSAPAYAAFNALTAAADAVLVARGILPDVQTALAGNQDALDILDEIFT